MKTKWAVFISILVLPLLPACGVIGEPSVSKLARPVKRDPVPAPDGAQNLTAFEAAQKGALQCPFPEECEPSVALISVVTKEGVDRCSGVLISGDRVLTNEHCLRDALGSCRNSVFIHFAETVGAPAQHARCEEIEKKSTPVPGGMGMDYAVIRLDQPLPERKPAPLSKTLPANREALRILRVQMDGGGGSKYGGSQEALRCDVAEGPYTYPELDSNEFELMSLGDCAIQAGNSGSPVLNQDGELVGLVQGYLRLTEEESAKPAFRELLLDESFGQTAIATRIGCIPGMEDVGSFSCRRAPVLSGRSPRDFVRQAGAGGSPELPRGERGLDWRELRRTPRPEESGNPEELEKSYALAPSCGRESSLRANLLRFRRGINRELLPEWRRGEGEELEFSLEAEAVASSVRYVSSSGLVFSLPVCR